MKCSINILFIIFLILAAAESTSPQARFRYDSSAERRFTRALQSYQRQEYGEAIAVFDSLLAQQPVHQRTTAAFVMAGKTLCQQQRYRASAVLLAEFLRSFPETDYADDARYTLGIDFMMLMRYMESATQFMRCLESTSRNGLSSKASSLLESLAGRQLTVENLEDLIDQSRRSEVGDLLSLVLAEKYMEAGRQRPAENLVDEILARETTSVYDKQIRMLKERLTANVNIKIGVVLPLLKKSLPSSTKTIAEEMLEGVAFALEEFRGRLDYPGSVSLEIRDSERDSTVAKSAVRELASMSGLLAIIGPLHSNIAAACARVAEEAGLPMILPTATANGIAAVGRHVFQAIPDISIRGQAMARYAVEELRLNNLAILASSEPNGKMLAESFHREVLKLNARVVALEYYAKGSSDLSDQFINIRSAGLKLRGNAETATDTDVPVRGIDGLFLPIAAAEDIGMLVSQIKYFNIETQLLGSSDWYEPSQIEANKRYLNGLIIATDLFVDENETSTIEFEKRFIASVKKRPSKYSIIGYDTMRMILERITAGATSRERFVEALKSMSSYTGIHGKTAFTAGRVNSELQMLNVISGQIHKIGEINIR